MAVLTSQYKMMLISIVATISVAGSQENGAIRLPIFGSCKFPFGYYYTKVKFGNPTREFNLLIDTGSDISWLPCSTCWNCNGNKTHFDPSKSSTARVVSCEDKICQENKLLQCSHESNQCTYSIRYDGGTKTSGYLLMDYIGFDGVTVSIPVIFGCTEQLSTNFLPTDGILGLGPGPLSLSSWLSGRNVTPRVFSHCMSSGRGGSLIMGEAIDPGFMYTPLFIKRHYGVHLQGITINGRLLPIDFSHNKEIFVDSGTLLVYLLPSLYDPVIATITDIVSQFATQVIHMGRRCYNASVNTSIFPTLTFQFAGGASMELEPNNYLVKSQRAPLLCLGILVDAHGHMIIGDVFLKDKIVVYDVARMRVGWTKYNCSQPVNISLIRNPAVSSASPRAFLDNVLSMLSYCCFLLVVLLNV